MGLAFIRLTLIGLGHVCCGTRSLKACCGAQRDEILGGRRCEVVCVQQLY